MVPQGNGAQYMLALEEEAGAEDLIIHDVGVRVITDLDSAPLLEGAEIDYSEGLMRSGFIITNPNIAISGAGAPAAAIVGAAATRPLKQQPKGPS